MAMDKDRELLTKIVKGDDQAWVDMVNHHYDDLVLFCGLFVKNFDDARDIAHDAFIKAKQKISKFNMAKYDAIRPWLWQIARNHARDVARKNGKLTSFNLRQSATGTFVFEIRDERPGPKSKANQADMRKLLFEALKELDEKFTEVVYYRYMFEIPRKEIAVILDIPEETVKSRLRLALQKLRKRLPEDLYE